MLYFAFTAVKLLKGKMIAIFRPLLLPLILLGSFYFALPHVPMDGGALSRAFPYIPYIVFTIGILLSLRFNVSRSLHILMVMIVVYYVFSSFMQQGSGAVTSKIVFEAISILLPLNIAFFSILKERGVFTGYGIMRVIFMSLQIAYVGRLIYLQDLTIYSSISSDFLPFGLTDMLPVSHLSVAVMLVSMVTVILSIAVKRSPVENGFFGLLIAVVFAILLYERENLFTMFISAGGLMLCVGIVQKSHHMAYRDELTGLLGRRALNERLLMLGRNYVIAMLDVDHFKKFNDTYGHDIGDQVLKMVAGQMKKVTGGGRPYRYGGEEFTVIFPGKDIDSALPHLETLRSSIGSYSMAIRGKDRPKANKKGKSKRGAKKSSEEVSVTISIGVAARGSDAGKPEAVIKLADEALYRAKKKGRNCVSK